MDGRKNNGGSRPNSGRKPKDKKLACKTIMVDPYNWESFRKKFGRIKAQELIRKFINEQLKKQAV